LIARNFWLRSREDYNMTSRFIPDIEVAELLYNGGLFWKGYDCVRVLQGLIAENNLDAFALNPLDKPGLPDYHSVDVGLCSLNTWWIPEPSLWERLNPESSIFWAWEYWNRWMARPDVKAIMPYEFRRDYVLSKMWHAVNTKRFVDAFPRALGACRAARVPGV
jgi:hypothetical protein